VGLGACLRREGAVTRDRYPGKQLQPRLFMLCQRARVRSVAAYESASHTHSATFQCLAVNAERVRTFDIRPRYAHKEMLG